MRLRNLAGVAFLLLYLPFVVFPQTEKPDELSIYSLVIKEVIEWENSKYTSDETKIERLIITKETISETDLSSLLIDEPPSQKGLSANFVKANQEPLVLTPHFSRDKRFLLVDFTEITDLIVESKRLDELERQKIENDHFQLSGRKIRVGCICCNSWSQFRRKFPNDYANFRFSRIGYSSNGRYALVEVDGSSACGSSNYSIYLRKTSRGWKIHSASAGFSVA